MITLEKKLCSLLSQSFLESFWFEIDFIGKKPTERDFQRVFVFCMRCFFPEYFTKMISDIPGVNNSLGYDIVIYAPEKTFFVEMKIFKKGKIEKSQESFRNEISGFSFLEHNFTFVDTENKKLIFY